MFCYSVLINIKKCWEIMRKLRIVEKGLEILLYVGIVKEMLRNFQNPWEMLRTDKKCWEIMGNVEKFWEGLKNLENCIEMMRPVE